MSPNLDYPVGRLSSPSVFHMCTPASSCKKEGNRQVKEPKNFFQISIPFTTVSRGALVPWNLCHGGTTQETRLKRERKKNEKGKGKGIGNREGKRKTERNTMRFRLKAPLIGCPHLRFTDDGSLVKWPPLYAYMEYVCTYGQAGRICYCYYSYYCNHCF